MEKKSLDISWSSILKVVVTLAGLYFVVLVHDILILTVFGLVIAILVEWPVRNLSRRMPRGVAVLLVYVAFLLSLAFLFYLPISTITMEVKEFVKLLPFYFEQISPPLKKLGFEAFQDLQSFTEYLDKLSGVISSNILNAIFYIFGGVASSIYVLSMSLFLVLEGQKVQEWLRLLFAKEDEKVISSIWLNSEKKVGIWFIRILIGCIFLGVTSYVTFLILNVNYPLSLAVFAGAANFVPIVGPIIATFILFVVISLDSVSKAVFAALIYTVLQQMENNIIGPLILKRFAGLSPTLIIFSLAVGAKLAGGLGAILMVPLVGVATEFAKGMLERQKKERVEVE